MHLKFANLSPVRDQRGHRNIYTTQIKKSKIEIFNFVVSKCMNGTKITENNLATEIDVV